MKTKVIMSVLLIGSILASCSTKTAALKDLRSLSQQIETKGATYNVEEWKEVKSKYEKINENIQKHEYTAQEYEEIGRLNGKCLAGFAKGVATNVKGKVESAASVVKGLIDGIKEAVEK